jgi:hypothetical protein
MSIAGRAISTMIASSGYNDVVRIWNTTQRDGIDYNLAFIPRDFTATYTEPFEQAYMRALFDFGFERAPARLRLGEAAAVTRLCVGHPRPISALP